MRLAHAGLIVSDLEIAAGFYEGVLGLQRLPRPDLGFPGLFYRLGIDQELHLMLLPDPCAGHDRPEHGGRDRHLALSVAVLPPIESALLQAEIPFTRSRSGRKAIFCRDPFGNALEFVSE